MRACLLLVLLMGACSAGPILPTDGEARPAADAPEQFLVATSTGRASMEMNPDAPCRSVMADPRDGMRIRLVRSAHDRGDYDVPTGRYGVNADELLRLECGTGRVVGIVQR